MTSLGDYAFNDTSNLKVYFETEYPPLVSNAFGGTGELTAYVPSIYRDNYDNDANFPADVANNNVSVEDYNL